MSVRRTLLVGAFVLLGGACTGLPAFADEFRPAYLQLTQVDSTTYDVLWKIPALDEERSLAIRPEFPPGTEAQTAARGVFAAGTATQRWRIRAVGGLEGRTIRFGELGATRIDVIVRLVRRDGTEQLERVLPGSPQFVVRASPGPLEVVRTYTVLGIEHILLGFDHLLFVLALVLIVAGRHRLLQTITAFTLAHSISLALATLGVVQVPGPPVEAIIALSIVFVAAEIVQQQRGVEGLTARKPWAVAFTFGLLHGLGFAGALAQIGLAPKSIPLSLLCFNVGVEIGQLLFVAAVLLGMRGLVRLAPALASRRRGTILAAYAIGGLAGYWVVERIAGFWS